MINNIHTRANAERENDRWLFGAITIMGVALLLSATTAHAAEPSRAGTAKPPAECASAKNASECAEILKKLGKNPFNAFGYVGAEPVYGTPDREIFVWGMGSWTCGDWVTERKRADDGLKVRYAVMWIQGYVTGLNSGLPASATDTGAIGEHIDIPALEVWIDNYCQAHPLDQIISAAQEFYNFVSDPPR